MLMDGIERWLETSKMFILNIMILRVSNRIVELIHEFVYGTKQN